MKHVNIALPQTETVTSLFSQQSSCLQMSFAGDLKSTTSAALHRDAFLILASETARSLQINMVEIDITSAAMVDSLGLNLIIAILKWAKQRDAQLRILVAKRGVYSTILAVGLDRQAEVVYKDPEGVKPR